MKKYILIFFSLSITIQVFCQQLNLVPNPGFEEYDTCPTNGSHPGDPQLERCKYWNLPTEGTADYLNICAPIGADIHIPSNFAGFQFPLDGNAYCGINAFYDDFYNPNDDYREYIQTKLNSCLEQGQEYYFEFYVCRGEVYGILIDKIGALFTSYPVSRTDAEPIVARPQIENPHHHLITDTVNWTKISGTFIAEGGECYLTIGNFYPASQTDTVLLQGDWPDDYAYLYIDGILLKEVESEITIPNVFTPNNDDYNDLFRVEQKSIVEFNACIYNRWGSELYKWDDVMQGWNGKYKGNNCPDGVYFYVIKAKGGEGKEYDLHGVFHLLR
ncbi:MAG TPA: gliding motility-associated C-terminal domain-containing protein [Bacteroidales bacterium]|nr:gliding motility-associated C-terminal domain-containing protein [Bacteroidales bacterium]HPS26136.1 gliding motility-associated C-terminal domain-containing protein [Bacteroidales bacterium]